MRIDFIRDKEVKFLFEDKQNILRAIIERIILDKEIHRVMEVPLNSLVLCWER